MTSEQHTLLLLVRSALWNRPVVSLPDGCDWHAVYDLAKKQTLTGLLADSIAHLSEECQPPADVLTKLRNFRINSIRTHAMLNARLAEIIEMFRVRGIVPILFKGQGLASNYPDPTARQCGDIDLFVGRDYAAASAAAYEMFGKQNHDSESIKHLHLSYKGVEVELHKIAETLPSLSKNRKYQKWTGHHLYGTDLRTVNIGGCDVMLPPYQFDCIYILNHLWHHFINGGVGLRQVCDWTVYLHTFHGRIDERILENDLQEFGLLKVWQIFSYIAVNCFGLPEEECPLYDSSRAAVASRVLEHILEEGNFGRHSDRRKTPRPEGYSAGKLHSFYNATCRYFRIVRCVPDSAISYYFSYLTKGIYHFFKGLG